MAIGTRYYFEIDLQQARLQFWDGSIFINEWIAHDGDTPTLYVPSFGGATQTREEWYNTIDDIERWIVGAKNANIYFSMKKKPVNFKLEVEQDDDEIKLEYNVNDILGVEQPLREMTYIKATDSIMAEPRPDPFTMYWVDFVMYLAILNGYRLIVDRWYNGTII